jgi:putative nucleotidyltransferase with HDIG domain
MQAEKLMSEMKRIALARIASDRLVLPTLSPQVTRVLEMLSSQDVNFRTVASILEKDPLLAVQVMRLANSAALAGSGLVKNIEQAITRLGSNKLRTVLLEISVRSVFQSRDPRIADANRALWEHSLAVAMIARDVAGIAGCPHADEAYLTGLLHDVGKPIVAVMLLEAEKMIAADRRSTWIDGDAWVAAIQEAHRPIGAALAEKWNLPPAVLKSIRDCNDYDNSDRISVSNIVLFSNAIAKREAVYVGKVDLEDIDAMMMIGRSLLGLDEEVVGRLARGLKERVRQQVS